MSLKVNYGNNFPPNTNETSKPHRAPAFVAAALVVGLSTHALSDTPPTQHLEPLTTTSEEYTTENCDACERRAEAVYVGCRTVQKSTYTAGIKQLAQ